ncbi:HAD family hydrolase [Alkalimarinus alittae]|uniref:HAD family hydrolase n=1 Tax=Alkalimarinus alittae TaxID=2961619 RepID=A0ABY6N2X4_9ALTE|nr:HAD family hydrolase [Alkalimarinus alittae]UZE96462.1 HAD family hydrolase [Alkalimarinus alittae]
MIKLITFDLDNTLWNSDPVLAKAETVLYSWLEKNCPELASRFSVEAIRDYKAAIANDNPALLHRVSALRLEVLRIALLDVGYASDAAEQQAKQAFQVFHAARQQVTLFEHAEHLLKSLSLQYQLAALTNGNADVSIIGLDRYFDFALTAEEIGKQKPHPDMFLAALEKAEVEAAEVIHIGDHPEQDIMGAHGAGLHTIWVNFDETPWDSDLVEGHDAAPGKVANCLTEIPKLIGQIENSLIK